MPLHHLSLALPQRRIEGFNICDDKGKICITVAYRNKHEADAAAQTIREVLSAAIWAASTP